MIACGRNVRTGFFVGSFFSITIFCIVVWKIIFGCNITNNGRLQVQIEQDLSSNYISRIHLIKKSVEQFIRSVVA